MRQMTVLSHTDAVKIIDFVRQELEKDNLSAAVAVVDEQGTLMAFLRTDGCPLASITIAQNKAYTAVRERAESKEVGRRSKEEGFPMTNFGELRYVTWGGGVPIVHDGQTIGAVGISGLPEEVDMTLARKAVQVIS